jgi:hypothetical protein
VELKEPLTLFNPREAAAARQLASVVIVWDPEGQAWVLASPRR